MKHVSTRFWLSVSAGVLLLLGSGGLAEENPGGNPKERARRNELTLASLRPGRDAVSKAVRVLGEPLVPKTDKTSASWEDICRWNSLVVDSDGSGKILSIRVTHHRQWIIADCVKLKRDPWRTGRNLAVSDPCSRSQEIYGKPTSTSPSTKDGKPLELLYYAFDWAGPDVPQVMEVVCSAPKEGNPGQVVEITLAAPSL